MYITAVGIRCRISSYLQGVQKDNPRMEPPPTYLI